MCALPISNNRGSAHGLGALSWSVNRDSPATLGGESVFVREDGFYTLMVSAAMSVRPTSSRVFLQINRNDGFAARTPGGVEDQLTVIWQGWCNAGDKLGGFIFFEGSGSYTVGSTLSIVYHGE